MQVQQGPSDTLRQVSGQDDDGRPFLAVLCKRTFKVLADGQCVPAEVQEPLALDLEVDGETQVVTQDMDTAFHKPRVDVIVRGHAYARRGERVLDAAVEVDGHRMALRVQGDRTVHRDTLGRLVFSEPAAFERIPLSPDRAYGGCDAANEALHGNPYADLAPFMDGVDPATMSPWRYPRNGEGRGYVIQATPEALARTLLPNLEDPADLLSPERFEVGGTDLWPRMPMAWSTDWQPPDAFPRVAWLGATAEHALAARDFIEVRRGWMEAAFVERAEAFPMVADPRFANQAHPALQVPGLRSGAAIVLSHLHPHFQTWVARPPVKPPRLFADRRDGGVVETVPARLHTVLVKPDEETVSMLWCGVAPALRQYLPDELDRMPVGVAW